MSKTIPELAKKYNLTPQAIQQRMRKIPDFLHNYTSKPHRSRLISDKGVKILFSNDTIAKSKGHAEREHKARYDAYVAELHNQIHDLKHDKQFDRDEIKSLNNQIKSMTLTTNNLYERFNSIHSRLQNANSNIKLLQFKNKTVNKELLGYKASHPSKPANSSKTSKSTDSGNSKPAAKHSSWWSRFLDSLK